VDVSVIIESRVERARERERERKEGEEGVSAARRIKGIVPE